MLYMRAELAAVFLLVLVRPGMLTGSNPPDVYVCWTVVQRRAILLVSASTWRLGPQGSVVSGSRRFCSSATSAVCARQRLEDDSVTPRGCACQHRARHGGFARGREEGAPSLGGSKKRTSFTTRLSISGRYTCCNLSAYAASHWPPTVGTQYDRYIHRGKMYSPGSLVRPLPSRC
ncbi:hypothetical protein EV126DRAFT_92173 [Verticillium dahliae]|nr:hypothetical protein EV126DRAFT_92173 [Verticillium dahliae]